MAELDLALHLNAAVSRPPTRLLRAEALARSARPADTDGELRRPPTSTLIEPERELARVCAEREGSGDVDLRRG